MDRKPHATLSNRQARGGVIGGKGYGFQAAYIVSQIPLWLADIDFVQFLQEGAGDVDVRLNRPDGEERWYVQVKNHEVGVTEARQVLAQFREMDVDSSGTYSRFTLACPGLTRNLKQLRAAVEELRGTGRFFRPGKDPILDNTRADLESLVQRLRLPTSTDFLVDKVYFDTDLAGLTDDGSLRDLFVGRLQRPDTWARVTFEEATRAYERLALLAHRAVRKTCSREQVEAIIWETVGEVGERLPPEYDDFVTRVSSVVADLGSVLTLETALYLTNAILSESPWPAEEIWESCRGELSRKELSLETVLFKARVGCYWGMRYAVNALEELVNVCGRRSDVVEEAASLRFRLAGDTARRAYDEERPRAQAEFDEADRSLRWLYKAEAGSAHSRTEIRLAQQAFTQAESRLRKLSDEYYVEEVDRALAWANSAQELDPDNPSVHRLITEIQREMIQAKMRSGMIHVDRVMLRDRIRQFLGEGDLRDICFELDVDYDSLRGEGRGDRARELVSYLFQCGRLHELVEACARLRPNVSWWTYPTEEMRLHSWNHSN